MPDPWLNGPAAAPPSALAELARAAGLDVDEIDLAEPLEGLGVDSVRLMALVDGRRAAGLDVSYPRVLAARTVGDALRVLDGPA